MIRGIYSLSPVFLQNLFTTVYGYRLHAFRYGGAYTQCLAEIESSQWLAPAALRDMQLVRLKELLCDANSQTEFYQERFKSSGFDPGALRSLGDLSGIPLLSREDIRLNAERMVAKRVHRRDLIVHHTSGTTGTPLRFYLTPETFQRNYAFWMRFRHWMGFKEWLPRATFGGRVVVPRGSATPPYWRYSHAERQTVFSSFHLSEDTAPAYARELERVAPFLIDGYVSSIFVLAQYVNRMGVTSIRPSAVQTTSETLFDFQRREIERAFGCPVYNQYGHGENAVFISQCERGSLHVSDEYGVVEILADGVPAKEGEAGEIVVTGFNNRAMPLIRYRTGDIAIAGPAAPCSCGRGLSRVSSLQGRVLDVLRMPDGKIVPPTALTLLFDKAQAMGIDEAQIVQEAASSILVRLVLRHPGRHFATGALEHDLRSMMGDEVRIRFETVDHIARSSSGKFRFVMSEVTV